MIIHCETCGSNYDAGKQSSDDEGRVRYSKSHHCPYPFGVFFERNEIEYEWREGIKHHRRVTYIVYSGHYSRRFSETLWSPA